jgi:hypothetical protein
MKFKELDLRMLKRHFKFKSASIRYHNKHRDGSGNFGTNLTKGTYGKPDWENWEISGNYKSDGELYGVSFGKAFWAGARIDMTNMTMNLLMDKIKNIMIQMKSTERGINY